MTKRITKIDREILKISFDKLDWCNDQQSQDDLNDTIEMMCTKYQISIQDTVNLNTGEITVNA